MENSCLVVLSSGSIELCVFDLSRTKILIYIEFVLGRVPR